MRSPLIKGLVDSLGERGHIALPLLEQLLPVVPVTALDRLGSPCGVPVRSYVSFAGTPAQRAGMFYRAPTGMVLRIDGVMSNANAIAISYGRAVTPPTSLYVITDWRRRVNSALSTPGLFMAGLANTDAAAQWAAGYGLVQIGVAAAEEWYPGPIYVDGDGSLAVWHTADAQDASFTMFGEVFELG